MRSPFAFQGMSSAALTHAAAATAPVFDPAHLPGTVLELDWSDQSTMSLLGSNLVSIASRSSGAQSFQQTTVAQQPTLVPNAVGGLSVMQTSGQQHLTGPRVTGRFFLQVLSYAQTTGFRPFLGDTVNQPDFHADSSTKMFRLGITAIGVRNGSGWLNSVSMPLADIDKPTDMALVAIETAQDASFDSISADRHFAGRQREGQTAALLVMDTPQT